MRSRFVLLVAVTLFFTFACNKLHTETAGPSQPPMASSPANATSAVPDELAAPRALFKEHCAKCHGDNGAGGRVQVEGTEIKVPNLTGAHARKPSDEKLAAKITNGDDEMPAFKEKLSAQQIADLVRFIRKEFQAQ